MRWMLAAVVLLVFAANAPPAHADMGSYTTRDGLMCNWSGFGSTYQLHCSGISMPSGQYVSYDCTISVFGQMVSYTCRDFNGATWSGSR